MTDFTNKVISEPQSNQYVELINSSGNPFYILASDLKTYTNTQAINEDAEVTGVSAGTTTTYLSYGVNVVTTADASNYAIRLPYPPIKGRTVTIINTTSIPIVVYPSITGGSINGVVNGTATIPADNNAYTFTCWENPLPGAWSWTAPAINQYDSGDITITTAGGISATWSAYDSSNVLSNLDFNPLMSDPLNNSFLFAGPSGLGGNIVMWRPNNWANITKIKVYTNRTLGVGNYPLVRLHVASVLNYYEAGTTNWSSFATRSNDQYVLFDFELDQVVTGTQFSSPVSNAIGDPATLYDEATNTRFTPVPTFVYNGGDTNVDSTSVGNFYAGTETVEGTLMDKYFTNALCFQINPRLNGTHTFKFRFFIEHT